MEDNNSISGDKLLEKMNFYRYNETTLFFINLIIVFLVFIDAQMRVDMLDFFMDTKDGPFCFLFILVGFITVFRLALSRGENKGWKTIAGLYIVLINLFVGLRTLDYLDQSGSGLFQYVFPIINVSFAFAFILAFRANFIEPRKLITYKQAKKMELLLGVLLIPLFVFTSEVFLHNHWTVTFSMCLFYVTFINSLVVGLLSSRSGAVLSVK